MVLKTIRGNTLCRASFSTTWTSFLFLEAIGPCWSSLEESLEACLAAPDLVRRPGEAAATAGAATEGASEACLAAPDLVRGPGEAAATDGAATKGASDAP